MLTTDHVRASKKNGELVLKALSPKERPRALELARTYLDVAAAQSGATRADPSTDSIRPVGRNGKLVAKCALPNIAVE